MQPGRGWYEKIALKRHQQQMIDEYLDYLRDKGFHPTTIKTRRCHAERIAKELTFGCTEAEIVKFLKKKNLQESSYRAEVHQLHAFFKWAHEAGYLYTDPMAQLSGNPKRVFKSVKVKRKRTKPTPQRKRPSPATSPATGQGAPSYPTPPDTPRC